MPQTKKEQLEARIRQREYVKARHTIMLDYTEQGYRFLAAWYGLLWKLAERKFIRTYKMAIKYDR